MTERPDNICILPWTHMHIMPDGQVHACCVSRMQNTLGNVKEQSFSEVWNSEAYRDIRRRMLAGEKLSMCDHCWKSEERDGGSFRQHYNKVFAHHMHRLDDTTEDGSLPYVNLIYLDARLSNFCNFKCRICSHIYSSAWYHDQIKYTGKGVYDKAVIRLADDRPTFFEELRTEIIPSLEEVYFAGGEPLIMPDAHAILDELIAQKKFDVRLWYNTNLSKLIWKDVDILEKWKMFPNVKVQASLDAMGARAEYLRKGTVWTETEENARRIKKECPHVEFEIGPTTMNLNVWHLPDFFMDWQEKGLCSPDLWNLNLLNGPAHYRAEILPMELHKETIVKNREMAERLPKSRAKKAFENTAKYLEENHNPDGKNTFMLHNGFFDSIRNEHFQDIFPEFIEWF